MIRHNNYFMTDGTAALQRNYSARQGSDVRVVCVRGANSARNSYQRNTADSSMSYRQYALNSANDIADSIEYGSLKGQAASIFTRAQCLAAGVITAVLSLAFVVM